jgi:hypothetical protein
MLGRDVNSVADIITVVRFVVNNKLTRELIKVIFCSYGPGSSVGIATDYGLGGPGIESRCGRDFPNLSRPALGPSQPPVQWVQVLSRG